MLRGMKSRSEAGVSIGIGRRAHGSHPPRTSPSVKLIPLPKRSRETAPRAKRNFGLSLIEVTIAMAVATVALLASAGTFASSLDNVESSNRITEAAEFAETVLEDISDQDYTVLLSLDGNEVFDGDDEESSNFRAEVTVFQAAAGLRQVRLLIRDMRTDQELGRITLQRAES